MTGITKKGQGTQCSVDNRKNKGMFGIFTNQGMITCALV